MGLLELFVKGLVIGLVLAAPVGPIGFLCISRTLERILHDYEEDYVRFHQKPLKKKAA